MLCFILALYNLYFAIESVTNIAALNEMKNINDNDVWIFVSHIFHQSVDYVALMRNGLAFGSVHNHIDDDIIPTVNYAGKLANEVTSMFNEIYKRLPLLL